MAAGYILVIWEEFLHNHPHTPVQFSTIIPAGYSE
jgi:hypothetical protein